MIDFEKYGKQHNKRVNDYIKIIYALYKACNRSLIGLSGRVSIPEGSIFTFYSFPSIRNEAEKIKERLITDIVQVIRDGGAKEWEAGNDSINALLKTMPGGIKNYPAFNSDNLDVLATMDQYARTDKIREYVEQWIKTVELAITDNIVNPVPQSSLVAKLDYALQKPLPLSNRAQKAIDGDNLTIALGSYVLSQESGVIGGGIGHYKSSYRNVYRMAMTVLDNSYSASIETRTRQINIIVGYRWVTAMDFRVCKICRYLAGNYPSSFVMYRVHPQCRCYAVPILAAQSFINQNNERISNGLDPLPASDAPNYVSRPHKDFYNWINLNRETLTKQYRNGHLYDWITNNPDFVSIDMFLPD